MTPLLCGLAAAVLFLSAVSWRSPAVDRVRALAPVESVPAGRSRFHQLGDFVWLGLRRLPGIGSITPTPSVVATTGAVAGMAMLLLFVLPAVALGVAAGWVFALVVSDRQRQRRRRLEIDRQLPLVVDLYRIALSSGYNTTMATTAVADRTTGPLGEELRMSLIQVANGARIADALEGVIDRTSEAVRPLISALASADRYGAPVNATLERLGVETRFHSERMADESAKRLSIALLFPVAGCTLPAFALLTVAPLLAGSFASLASSLS